MGSDQSSQKSSSKSRSKLPSRSQSNEGKRGSTKNNSNSPRPSICSDSDIPYISYLRSREDPPSERKVRWNDFKPKLRDTKHMSREKRDSKSKSVGSLVTIKSAPEAPTLEKNPLYLRLNEIPPFVPIIRGSLRIPWTRDEEIEEKLSFSPLVRIALFFEERLLRHAQKLEREQVSLSAQSVQIEKDVSNILKSYGDRQRKFGKIGEKLSKVGELSVALTNCHETLNSVIESIEVLNNLLPPDERLEPFVWTTG